jgi:tetratricopeptide (TPR) repeat protein
MTAAQGGRMDEARTAFLAGWRAWPADPRFPVELGGVAFKQKRYAEAARWLRRGMRLQPGDSYTADFLATVYFLEGNIEAALKCWNRVGKPRIENVRIQPGLRTDSVLLDRAFTFAAGGTLTLSHYLTTRARLDGLEIFPAFSLRLDGRTDGGFDATFAARERNGFGSGTLEALVSTFRGAAYQTMFPEYFNIGASATNAESMVRWDAQKRRLASSFSGPWRHDARRRYRIGMDLRNENWNIGGRGALNLRRDAVRAEILSFPGAGWSWSTGAEFSHRGYRNVAMGPGVPPESLLPGSALKHLAQIQRELWRVPERRFEIFVQLSAETGTVWSSPAHTFERLQVELGGTWYPRMTGDDYKVQHQIRSGRIFGQAPFDELYMLGLERDNDLWLRAHIGTHDGRKGSAPLGREYFLSNWEIDKNIYRNAMFTLKLSPFVDTGRISAGSEKWLWDMGLQAKLRVLGVGFDVIYGKDLRSGQNAFYLIARR